MTLRELVAAALGGSAEPLRAQGLPRGVAEAVAAGVDAGRAHDPAPEATRRVTLGDRPSPRASGAGRPPHAASPLAWRATPGGGWVLAEPVSRGGLLRWAELDRSGQLTALLHWSTSAAGEPRLARAMVRAPDLRWAAVLPMQGNSTLWSPADAIASVRPQTDPPGPAAEAAQATMPAQDYARLTHIPPVDRPAALPRGVGTAVLNLLAQLMSNQQRDPVRYRGPYPTPALFEALCASFAPEGPLAVARARFTRDAAAQAFAGEMREQPLPWSPRPYVASVYPDDNLYVQWRGASEMGCVWLGESAFARCAPRLPMPAGGRLWREDTPRGPREAVGLVALGRPFRRYMEADPAAGTFARAGDWDEGTAGTLPGGGGPQPLEDALRLAAVHWAVVRCTPALAPAVAGLAASLPMTWAPVPRALTRVDEGGIAVHAGLGPHFRALAANPAQSADGPQALALMLVSDLFAALAVDLARLGQARLEAEPTPEVAALLARGRECQQAAQQALAQLLPRVLAQLAQGLLLPG
ncbi:MAG: hypothetical protein HY342_03475 [Candidatus Lambdaproteobacteria bacterium]|nr:hypothetical protein [Candidatus Lambdaproteobacteria bacterium]